MEDINDFDKSLEIANKYEYWFAENFLKGKKYKMNNDNRYDIITDDGTTIEIKNDNQSSTGNIAVEWFCRNKPSCISVTQAYWYVFIFPLLNEVFICKTHELKKRIKDYQEGIYKENYTSNLFYYDNIAGGDLDNGRKVSKLHLMRREDNKDIFNIIKIKIPLFE